MRVGGEVGCVSYELRACWVVVRNEAEAYEKVQAARFDIVCMGGKGWCSCGICELRACGVVVHNKAEAYEKAHLARSDIVRFRGKVGAVASVS